MIHAAHLRDRDRFLLGLHARSTARCACWCCCIFTAWATRRSCLAFLFLLYETAGIAANLGGGWLALRFGIPRMLPTGQVLQIAGLLMLSALDPAWSAAVSVVWVLMRKGSRASQRM